jgi:hypothetical protein
MSKNEIWKDVPKFDGLYQISNFGRIVSYDRIDKYGRLFKGKVLQNNVTSGGYLKVGLCYNSVMKHFGVHRLVALAFIPNPENKPQVNHLNGIKFDNRVENLEWCTAQENKVHSVNNGTSTGHSALLTEDDVRKIKELLGNRNLTHMDIAIMFGVVKSTITKINTGINWGHIQ